MSVQFSVSSKSSPSSVSALTVHVFPWHPVMRTEVYEFIGIFFNFRDFSSIVSLSIWFHDSPSPTQVHQLCVNMISFGHLVHLTCLTICFLTFLISKLYAYTMFSICSPLHPGLFFSCGVSIFLFYVFPEFCQCMLNLLYLSLTVSFMLCCLPHINNSFVWWCNVWSVVVSSHFPPAPWKFFVVSALILIKVHCSFF